MKRESFKMFLKPGCKEEYKRRHANLFPELKALLSQSGVRNYSIYLDEEMVEEGEIDCPGCGEHLEFDVADEEEEEGSEE